uniref:G-protein coupled receptors family 1 profile domain-containing protein n=1 Tax=Plectus sambesii TaxID=2011161 RepID=A0A914XIW5_9BILA
MSGYLMLMVGLYAVCFMIGVPGNCWVIANLRATVKRNSGQHPLRFFTNQHLYLYVLALSCVDLLVLLMIPTVIVYICTASWYFGYIGCKLFWAIESVNKILSVAILMVMSFERYLCICRPFKRCHYRTRFSVMAVLVCCAVIVVLLLAPVIYYADTTDYKVLVQGKVVEKTSCSADLPDHFLPYFIGYMFITCFALPVTVTLICYLAIAHHVYARFSRRTKDTLCGRQNFQPFSMYTYRVVISILRVVLFHFVCWAPFWLSFLLPVVTNTQNSPFLHSPIAIIVRLLFSCLPYVNCSLNWVFYALLNRELRNCMKEMYRHDHRQSQTSWPNSFCHFALVVFGKRPNCCDSKSAVEMKSPAIAIIAISTTTEKLIQPEAEEENLMIVVEEVEDEQH